MEYTFDELKRHTVAQLREIAENLGDHEKLHGHLTMHKEQLISALCQVLGIEEHVYHEVVGINKQKVKSRIRDLRRQRDTALEAHDHRELKRLRRQIHHLKVKIRKATV